MEQRDDPTKAVEELEAAWAASVEEAERLLGPADERRAGIERLRNSPGLAGAALRRTEQDLILDLHDTTLPPERAASTRPAASGVRLSLGDFIYKTLGR
ncbi:MAG: hypothetical protein QME96_10290 [Myxococcota bacterium]|nr:hypothetical protein [Myxococcota bacterium]